MATSFRVLGARVHALRMEDLLKVIGESIACDGRIVIGSLNLHSLHCHQEDEKMREFFERADYIHIDGMSIVWIAKLLGLPIQRKHRVTYMNSLVPLLTEWVKADWKVFYLGSKPGVAEMGSALLKEMFPALQIATAHGHFNKNSQENARILEQIASFRPHILMVGMGVPLQEYWILENLEKVQANAILTCGATMDYVSGIIPRQPEWAGNLGLNWLFRLAAEPRRLWRRYLVEPWFLLRVLPVAFWRARFGRK